MQRHSLGDDAAEERDIEPEVLWQRVQAAHGSKVNQAVGGLLTVLDGNSSCRTQHLLNAFNQDSFTDCSATVLPAELIWTGVMGIVGVMSDT